MNYSLKAVLDIIEPYPEEEIVSHALALYDMPRGVLFNDKFIARTDFAIQGFDGFKSTLYNIYSIDESFMEQCLPELRALISRLKGEHNNVEW